MLGYNFGYIDLPHCVKIHRCSCTGIHYKTHSTHMSNKIHLSCKVQASKCSFHWRSLNWQDTRCIYRWKMLMGTYMIGKFHQSYKSHQCIDIHRWWTVGCWDILAGIAKLRRCKRSQLDILSTLCRFDWTQERIHNFHLDRLSSGLNSIQRIFLMTN